MATPKKTGGAKAAPTTRKAVTAPAHLEALRSYVRAKAPQLLAHPHVTSVGIGYAQAVGDAPPQLAVQFTVDQVAVPEALGGAATSIPQVIDVDGVQVPTEIIPRTYKPSYLPVSVQDKDPRKVRADVMVPGMSIGNLFTTAGTIGSFVRDRITGRTVLLSNWHVLHGALGQIGADIVQPGRHDDNRVEDNRVGQLLRSHLGSAGDCAIASIAGRAISNATLGLDVAVAAIGDPEIGDAVVKSGRTTGVTHGRVVRIEVNTPLNYGNGVQSTVGGFEIGVDPQAPPADGEVSRGGDSGACWFAVDRQGRPTDVMLGLHFAGDADGTSAEFALACYAKSVMTALEIEPLGNAALEGADLQDGLVPRSGFDPLFLGYDNGAPTFIKSVRDDLAQLDGAHELKYCHFSVWLSKQRRYPLCVAWNINGERFKRLKRTGFRTDQRGGLAAYQFSDALYVHNPFDKGHIARRADLCWGDMDEARQANYDSFYYTNIAPQHEAFNQSGDTSADPEGGVWGRLENTVFDSEAPHQLKVSVLGGPVFGTQDRKFAQNGEECLVPAEFWKVVAYRDERDGKEKVFGFLLTQKALIDPLTVPEHLNFEPWLWARITLRDLEGRTGIRFPKAMHQRESAFVAPQSAGVAAAIKPLSGPQDYFA
jgi:endonuclease G